MGIILFNGLNGDSNNIASHELSVCVCVFAKSHTSCLKCFYNAKFGGRKEEAT